MIVELQYDPNLNRKKLRIQLAPQETEDLANGQVITTIVTPQLLGLSPMDISSFEVLIRREA